MRNELEITVEELAYAVHVRFSTVNRLKNKKSVPNPIARVVLLISLRKESQI